VKRGGGGRGERGGRKEENIVEGDKLERRRRWRWISCDPNK
jgi:hypothetical protein